MFIVPFLKRLSLFSPAWGWSYNALAYASYWLGTFTLHIVSQFWGIGEQIKDHSNITRRVITNFIIIVISIVVIQYIYINQVMMVITQSL